MSNITEDKSGVLWLKWETESDLIATRLEKLATQFFQAHEHITDPSAATFIRSICCSSFQMLDCSDHDGPLPSSGTIDEHILNSQAFTRAYPEFTVKVINATADVDVDCKHAVVWVTIGGSNVSQELRRSKFGCARKCWAYIRGIADLNSIITGKHSMRLRGGAVDLAFEASAYSRIGVDATLVDRYGFKLGHAWSLDGSSSNQFAYAGKTFKFLRRGRGDEPSIRAFPSPTLDALSRPITRAYCLVAATAVQRFVRS
ncbi:hypothetical protein LTS10_007616 [Elasticomyces elasticus]|nr:hypothetical protein LTS10_007616 [Elasticomyces elasticus]